MKPPSLGIHIPDIEPPPSTPDPRPASTGHGLSWDQEDRAVAAAHCPWHPDRDWPDFTSLLRHVVGHARAWESEAMHAERQRVAMRLQVSAFAKDVKALADGLGGDRA